MTTNKPVSPKVFISYSHDSPEHADRVLDFAMRIDNKIVAEYSFC